MVEGMIVTSLFGLLGDGGYKYGRFKGIKIMNRKLKFNMSPLAGPIHN
jgi:hypothetical protein